MKAKYLRKLGQSLMTRCRPHFNKSLFLVLKSSLYTIILHGAGAVSLRVLFDHDQIDLLPGSSRFINFLGHTAQNFHIFDH